MLFFLFFNSYNLSCLYRSLIYRYYSTHNKGFRKTIFILFCADLISMGVSIRNNYKWMNSNVTYGINKGGMSLC
jgi:hypothetical protein